MRRVLALFAAGLLLAGCGSGGSRLSRADYAAREDAICSRYAKRIAALGQPKDLTELSKFASRAVAIARRAIDDARKLQPPKAEQAAVDKWNAENAKVADAIARLGRAIASATFAFSAFHLSTAACSAFGGWSFLASSIARRAIATARDANFDSSVRSFGWPSAAIRFAYLEQIASSLAA